LTKISSSSSGEIEGEDVPVLLTEGGFKLGLGGTGKRGLEEKLLVGDFLSLGGTGRGPDGFGTLNFLPLVPGVDG
jgi:hypothetical protein